MAGNFVDIHRNLKFYPKEGQGWKLCNLNWINETKGWVKNRSVDFFSLQFREIYDKLSMAAPYKSAYLPLFHWK